MTDTHIITAPTTGRDIRGWQFVLPCYTANTWTWLMIGDQLPQKPRRVVLQVGISHTSTNTTSVGVQYGRLSGEDVVKAGDPWNCPSWKVICEKNALVSKGGINHLWIELSQEQIAALFSPAKYGITSVFRFNSLEGAPVIHRLAILVLE